MSVGSFIAQQSIESTSALGDIAVASVAIALLAIAIAVAVGVLFVRRHRTTTERLEALERRVEELEQARRR
jgi:L-cystine uptake protein TcyP (sodium:dicarboxylate symporter family)